MDLEGMSGSQGQGRGQAAQGRGQGGSVFTYICTLRVSIPRHCIKWTKLGTKFIRSHRFAEAIQGLPASEGWTV